MTRHTEPSDRTRGWIVGGLLWLWVAGVFAGWLWQFRDIANAFLQMLGR